MLNISEDVKEKLLTQSVYREIRIHFPDEDMQDITSRNIVSESFELTQSICDSNDFVLGGCIAGRMSVQVINIDTELNNKRIQVYISQKYVSDNLYSSLNLYPNSSLFPGSQNKTISSMIFCGTIDSSLRLKNRKVKEIIAYDDMYLLSQIKCKSWLTEYVSRTSEVTLGKLINAVLDKADMAINRDIIRSGIDNKPINFNFSKKLSWVGASEGLISSRVGEILDDNVTVLDLLSAYCELNAQFAVIDNIGRIKPVRLFQYSLNKTSKKAVSENIQYYADLSFEEYTTRPINRIRFHYNKDKNFDYGLSATRQSWYVSDNLICKCLDNVGDIITAFNDNNGANFIFYDLYSYQPFTADVFARWWLEVGDRIQIKTGYNDTETIDSFIFERTIKGINGMRVTIKAAGNEFLGKDEITNG